MDKEAIQQIADAVTRIESKLDGFESKLDRLENSQAGIELQIKQQDIALGKKIRELGEQRSRDRDQMEMLKNQMQGAMALSALGGGRGPEPVQYVSTGTGLIDPEWRWEREHPFR